MDLFSLRDDFRWDDILLPEMERMAASFGASISPFLIDSLQRLSFPFIDWHNGVLSCRLSRLRTEILLLPSSIPGDLIKTHDPEITGPLLLPSNLL